MKPLRLLPLALSGMLFFSSVPAMARFSVVKVKQNQTFVPFVNKYVNLPVEWTTKTNKKDILKEVVFSKADGSTFTIKKFGHEECDVTKLKDRSDASFAAVESEKRSKVTYVRIPGMLGSALSWEEADATGAVWKAWCVVPIGRSTTSMTIVSATDGPTADFIAKTVLAQVYQTTKKR